MVKHKPSARTLTQDVKWLLSSAQAVNRGAHRLMVEKLTIMSAMKRPTMPNTPPLAPTNARQVSSNAALKKLPAGGITRFVHSS